MKTAAFVDGKFFPKFAATLACAAALSAHAENANVGFREIDGGGFVVGVWYPAAETPQKIRLGPFEVEYAKNAKPSGKSLPLAVLSHGANGRYYGHHLTASYLARNGFVVAAPQHEKIGRKFSDMAGRVKNIKSATAALRQEPGFKNILDANNVSAVGYSRGGAAVLAAAGANINVSAYKLHCAKNFGKDEKACGGFPWWARLFLRFKEPKKEILDFSENPAPFRKIVLVAPVGQGVDAESLARIPAKTLVMQITGDAELRAPFHAEYLFNHLPAEKTARIRLGGHHFAFAAPLPKRLTEKENISGAADPPGFNREKFIADANEKILFFLTGEN